ncbi:MAG: leucine-rich repeat protein [Oscillospiraceae bacterium]
MSDFHITDNILKEYTGLDEYITIPKGVTSIGDFAFFNCNLLKNLKLPLSFDKDYYKIIGTY